MSRYFRFFKSVFHFFVTGDFRISMKRLEQVEIVIWDETGSQILLETLNPNSYFILSVERSPIYINPRIVWRTVTRARFRRGGHFESVIELCNPSAVVTFIDNGPRFHLLASRFPDISFIAFQNGWRWPVYDDDPMPMGSPQEFNSFMFCFGQNDVDSLISRGYGFKAISVVGSIKNQIAIDSPDLPEADVKYDIGVISQFRQDINDPKPLQNLAEYMTVLKFLTSYLRGYPELKVCIFQAFEKGNSLFDDEVRFYEQHLGSHVNLVLVERIGMSSYANTQSADVILSASSTLGIECLARGFKTLVCSQPLAQTLKEYSFRCDWNVTSLRNDVFDASITKLLNMDREDFYIRNKDSIGYFMSLSDKPSILREFEKAISYKMR